VKRFPIVLTSLAVLLAACGGTTTETTASGAASETQTQDQASSTTDTPDEGSETDPLDPGDDGELTINDFIPGAVVFDENTDWRAQELEIQQQVAACMAEEGFEYIPFVPSDVGGGFGPEEFDEEEYVKTYGFGVSTWVLQEEQFQEGGEFEDPYADDPNVEIVDAMDEFEREEYYRILWGGEPEIIENTPYEEIEAMTPEEQEQFYNEAYENWVPNGCYNEASEAAYGGGESQNAFWEEFGEDYEDVYTRAESDPRILDAQAKWSACMGEKGYDYANQEEMYAYFWGTESGGTWVEGEFQQRVNELIIWPDYPEGEFIEGEEGAASGSVGVATTIGVTVEGEGGGEEFEYQGPEYDIEELQPLIDEEIAIATADYECSQFMREVFEEVYQEYEQRFIDENLDRLVAFKEANN